jgi:hypothetical protein
VQGEGGGQLAGRVAVHPHVDELGGPEPARGEQGVAPGDPVAVDAPQIHARTRHGRHLVRRVAE